MPRDIAYSTNTLAQEVVLIDPVGGVPVDTTHPLHTALIDPATSVPVDAGHPLRTALANGGTFSTAQVAVLTTATALIAANPARYRVTLKNTGAASVFIGGSAVTTTTGHALAAGETLTLLTGVALYAIAAATGNTVTLAEEAA